MGIKILKPVQGYFIMCIFPKLFEVISMFFCTKINLAIDLLDMIIFTLTTSRHVLALQCVFLVSDCGSFINNQITNHYYLLKLFVFKLFLFHIVYSLSKTNQVKLVKILRKRLPGHCVLFLAFLHVNCTI